VVALPLFATGLGAIGLFGQRRKPKAHAIPIGTIRNPGGPLSATIMHCVHLAAFITVLAVLKFCEKRGYHA